MMLRAILPPITLGLLAAGLAVPVEAASFDCAKAQKPDEVAVCSNPDLSELDTEMGALRFAYDAFPFLMGMSGRRQDEAQEFLTNRAKCGADVACLRQVYRGRIAALREDIQRTMKTYVEPAVFAPSLPAGVEAAIGGYGEQCRQLGGTLAVGADRPLIMSADFDGDGAMDYVLNPQNMKCSTAATAFCGNGGCAIAVALSGNGYRKPLETLGGEPTVSQGRNGTTVEVWVDGSNCNATGYNDKACWLTYSWKNGKVHESYQIKPRPK